MRNGETAPDLTAEADAGFDRVSPAEDSRSPHAASILAIAAGLISGLMSALFWARQVARVPRDA